jgi:hypothetical protein
MTNVVFEVYTAAISAKNCLNKKAATTLRHNCFFPLPLLDLNQRPSD